jgi:hypothetical protein
VNRHGEQTIERKAMIYFFTGSDNKGQPLDEGNRRFGEGDRRLGEGDRRLCDGDVHIGDAVDRDADPTLHPSQRPSSRRRAAVKRRAMFVGVTDYRDVRG